MATIETYATLGAGYWISGTKNFAKQNEKNISIKCLNVTDANCIKICCVSLSVSFDLHLCVTMSGMFDA